ncbi:MAG: beta-galactosidase [Clostridia bacterium]|nr:beta-galactosidase [Clostridia bacterium]
MWLGVDYYPEQWDISLIDEDMDNILELGCNVIRIGEFSWHLMEKREGEYDFSFFDSVIAKAKKKGLRVIMGTPTATIPAWLANKHPSILSEFEGGMKRTFGGRHVYCFNSPKMYEYSEKIITELAQHYKDEKSIIAWQIDNEFGHEGSDMCYCAQCRDAFRSFLSKKFNGDIDSLNDTYGTTFWSQEYNSFDEIPTPTATITTHNPALRLDWERFRSKSIVDFSDFQVDLIKKIIPDAVVFHDFPGGGLTKHVDYSRLAGKYDVAAYNNYPVWGGQREPLPPSEIAFGLDYIRGLKGENFWITEAIMGAQGHDITGYSPRPGQAVMWSYQGFAHGCDSLMYFRYRGAVKGAEQFCYGILDADNVKRRKFFEVQRCFADVTKYKDALEKPVQSKVAIVYDYDSLAAFRIQGQSYMLRCPDEMAKLHKYFYGRNISVDVIPSSADISKYSLVITPQMIIHKPEFFEKVREFVQSGKTAVITYRTSVKDTDNNLVFKKAIPLDYSDFAGVTVVETESLQEGQKFPVVGEGEMAGRRGSGTIFRDMLAVSDAEVLFRYGDMFYEDFAAVTRKKQGDGEIYYIGCGLDEDTEKCIFDKIAADCALEGEVTEKGVEVCYRGDGDSRVRIVMNHNGHEASYGERQLAPYECYIEALNP